MKTHYGDQEHDVPENEKVSAILASPYYRVLQTAQPFAQQSNLPISVEWGL